MTIPCPPVIAYDLEIASSIPEVDGKVQWHRAHECGIAVLVSWANWEAEPRVYLGIGDLSRFVEDIRAAPDAHLVTWNGITFDDPLISKVLLPGDRDVFQGLLQSRKRVDLCKLVGRGLDSTYAATFDTGTTKSMPGAQAPVLWQAGRYGEVIGYCVGDVYRTLRLWSHAWTEGYLVTEKDGRAREVMLPRIKL